MEILRKIIFGLTISVYAAICSYGQVCRLFTPEQGLSSSLVNYIYEDHYGLIWIATEDGLNKYDGVKITTYKHLGKSESSLSNNYVNALAEDAQGNLIVSTYAGLQIYRYSSDDFSDLGKTADGKVMYRNISDLQLGTDGKLYGIGERSCIIKVKDKDIEVTLQKEPYFSNKPSKELPAELNIRTTLRIDNNHLLLGTDGNGVKLYDERQKTYEDYTLNIPGIPSNLQKVHHMIWDRSGNLWVALYQKGVVMIPSHKNVFGYIGRKISGNNVIGAHSIQSIFVDKEGRLWVGTDGDGLYVVPLRDTSCSVHINQGVPPIISAVMMDSEGTLWLGSYGFPCYRKQGGAFEVVKGLPDKPRVFCMREDRKKHVWLGTMGNGLYCYDLAAECIRHIDDKNINKYINCLYVTSLGHLLVGSFYGVYDVNTRKQYCNNYIVYAIHESRDGKFWIGTSEGLVCLQGSTQKIYSTDDGMPSNTVYAICDDNAGHLWFSTNAGLSSFDLKSGIFTNYSVSDGIQGTEFSKGAMFKESNGTIWFAGNEGITYFQPQSVNRYQYNLHPRITALYINNIPINTTTKTEGESVCDSCIYDSRHFSIAYENNSFSIELATREIDTPSKCVFVYSMDDGEFITIPNGGHMVSFSNLESGKHIFRYAVEYNGKRSDVEEVEIIVRHPWWSTWWAKMLSAIVLVCIGILLYFWIRSREKVKTLALISHKIRTPMSLIISPLIQLIDNDIDEMERQNMYKLMLRNAEKLQRLAAQATEEEPIGPITSSETGIVQDVILQPSRSTKHILVVEDDDEVRNYLCGQLSSDYHIIEATNGAEALKMVFSNKPDAIISDVTMPEMDGITLCRKLKRNIKLAHIPVILLTARADQESTLQGLGTGADAYITKPFNIKILRQNINNLILLRQQLRNTYQGQQLQENRLEEIEVENYDEVFMERLMTVINKHLSDTEFSIDSLCKEVGISRAGLHRKLKEKTNQSASIFIRNVRLKQAERLLLETNLRVNEIASQVGFKQSAYFVSSFKELYGVTPNEWRNKNTPHT